MVANQENMERFHEKFNSDDDLPLNKQLKFVSLTIIVRTVFEEDGKYYPQTFLDEFL